MIRVISFDLDGTLVQTELLKAVSYARATQELCPHCLSEDEVLEAYKDVVGRSRQEVSQTLMDRFSLEKLSRERMAKLGVDQPWQAFVQVRLRIYDQMIEDSQLIRQHARPDIIAELDRVRGMGLKTALTTTSARSQATKVLQALEIADKFDFTATEDDVEHTKPHPEVYFLVSCVLEVPPKQILAIEDSLPGLQSATAAGMSCIAVPTDFTRDSVHKAGILEKQWIVEETDVVSVVVDRMLARSVHEEPE